MTEEQKILAMIRAAEINARLQSLVATMNGMLTDNENRKTTRRIVGIYRRILRTVGA
jgi:hypothetical protein